MFFQKTIEKPIKILYNLCTDPNRKGSIMKHKISVIFCAAIVLVLALSYFFVPEVTSSETEMRSMRTFGMIFQDIDSVDEDGEPTIVNNMGVSAPDRLENAMKDQIFVREDIMRVYNGIQTKFANLYSNTDKALKAHIKALKQLSAAETTAPPSPKDTLAPIEDETEPPVTVAPDDTSVEQPSSPDETSVPDETSIPDETSTEAPEEPSPPLLDFEKYPGYGFARLEVFPEQSYEYSYIGTFALYNGTDYVGAKPNKSVVTQEAVQRHIDQYEMLLEEYPNLKFYSYFVTQIQDTPWFYDFYGTYPDRHETIAQYLPEYVTVGRLIFKDFADYQDCYFKSDHHWAYKGSERAYQNIYNMMAEDLNLSPMKQPIKTWNFTELYGVEYRGSRANTLREAYSSYDEFIAYEYDLGKRKTYILQPDCYFIEIPVTMGLWEKYKVGDINKNKYFDHYIAFYGHAYDGLGNYYYDSQNCFVIKNDNDAEHSLLLICDSSQRPCRDVLGSHFKNVVTLDYRFMTKIPIDYLIEKYEIDTILCGSQAVLWSGSDKYLFTFSDDFGK